MLAEIRGIEPKELVVPNRPWLRRLGDYVVRYVRESIEPADLRQIRQDDVFEGPLLQAALSATRNHLYGEVARLEELGINYSLTSVDICKVPRFGENNEVIGRKLGLQLMSEFVDGPTLGDSPKGIDIGHMCSAMRQYVDERTSQRLRFLCQVFDPSEYRIPEDSYKAVLIGLDPIFAEPTGNNRAIAHAEIDYLESLAA